jgi:hypothetical protein
MQDAAITSEKATRRSGNNLSRGGHAVLQRHRRDPSIRSEGSFRMPRRIRVASVFGMSRLFIDIPLYWQRAGSATLRTLLSNSMKF